MNEVDQFEIENYYSGNLKELLNHEDYDNEKDRLKAEEKTRKKYQQDEIIKKELAEKEALKKQREDQARQKEKTDRQARLDAQKKILENEQKARELRTQQLQKDKENFNVLDTEKSLQVLNDCEPMQPLFQTWFLTGFKQYFSIYQDDFQKLPNFNKNLSENDLQKSDILFHKLFADIGLYEKLFLVYINKEEDITNGIQIDDQIAANFVYKNVSVAEIVKQQLGDEYQNMDENTRRKYQKFYVMKQIEHTYADLAKMIKINQHISSTSVNEAIDKAIEKLSKSKKETNTNLIETAIDDAIEEMTHLQYLGFCVEKNQEPNKTQNLEVIRPADDYTKASFSRKYWLSTHPEKEGKQYALEDLQDQLSFVKQMSGLVAKEQHISETICGKNTTKRQPISINRAKYELRELHSAFVMQAEIPDHNSALQLFNQDMAVLADYEAGDFHKLMREKPHIKHLVNLIKDGPLCSPVEGKTQKEVFQELQQENDGKSLQIYLKLVHIVVEQVKVEYQKQQLESSGANPQEEQEVKQACLKTQNGLSFVLDNIPNINWEKFDQYCRKKISPEMKETSPTSILSDAQVMIREANALRRGWNIQETFLFATLNAVYQQAKKLKEQDSQNYEEPYTEISQLIWNLDKNATTAIQKRSYLTQFEDFIRKHIKDKELVGSLENYQLQYDKVREAFDTNYKEAVIADLQQKENNVQELAKSLVEMQKIAFDNDAELHRQIFQAYINQLPLEKQKELQIALYQERMHQMVKRGEQVSGELDTVFEREELSSFQYNPAIYDDILAQVGKLISTKDGVTAVDKLSAMFLQQLSQEEKEKIQKNFHNEIDERAFKIGNKVFASDASHYEMIIAEKIEKNQANHGLTVVTAPEGGFNIRYDKPIIEIKKDILETMDAQLADLSVELAKIKTTMNAFVMEIDAQSRNKYNNRFHQISRHDNLYLSMVQLATMNDRNNVNIWAWRKELEYIRENIQNPLQDAQEEKEGTPGEVEFLTKVKDFTEKSLQILSTEHYPDVDFQTYITILKEQVEVSKILWENKDKGNKWEAKPTEFIKQQQKAKQKDPENPFYQSIAKNIPRQLRNLDDGYDNVFFKPSTILEMCEKYLGALQAIDGKNISNESKEYQEFYYSLKDLQKNFKGKEVSQEDGSHVTLDCLQDLKKSIQDYLDSKDYSKNAALRRNVARQIFDNYLLVESNNQTYHNVQRFEKWVKEDKDVQKALRELPEEAQKKRQEKIDAEKQAVGREKPKFKRQAVKEKMRKEASEEAALNSKNDKSDLKNKNQKNLQHYEENKVVLEHQNADQAKGKGNEIIPKDKIGKKAAEKFRDKHYYDNQKKYNQYIQQHTGDHKGTTRKTMLNNLAKVFAARALQEAAKENEFSVNTIHLYMDVMKENFCLNTLPDEKIATYLQSPNDAIQARRDIMKTMYGISPENYEKFCEDMQKLSQVIMSKEGRSTEYQDLVKRINKAAQLKTQDFSSADDKAEAYSQQAFLVTFTVTKYIKGKKSVRSSNNGKERFDNALDALAVVSKYCPNSQPRVNELVQRINDVRDARHHKKDQIDVNHFTEHYGASRAENAAKKRNAAPQKQNAKKKVPAKVKKERNLS